MDIRLSSPERLAQRRSCRRSVLVFYLCVRLVYADGVFLRIPQIAGVTARYDPQGSQSVVKARLGLAGSKNQSENAPRQQNHANRWRQLLGIIGLDSNFGASELHAVVLAVWKRDHEGEQTAYQQNNSNKANSIH
jgi:hypothetical protein